MACDLMPLLLEQIVSIPMSESKESAGTSLLIALQPEPLSSLMRVPVSSHLWPGDLQEQESCNDRVGLEAQEQRRGHK